MLLFVYAISACFSYGNQYYKRFKYTAKLAAKALVLLTYFGHGDLFAEVVRSSNSEDACSLAKNYFDMSLDLLQVMDGEESGTETSQFCGPLRLCVDLIADSHFDNFYNQILSIDYECTKITYFVASEFARHAKKEDSDKWNYLAVLYMDFDDHFFKNGTLFSILCNKFGVCEEIVEALCVNWPKSRLLCAIAVHYQPQELRLKNLLGHSKAKHKIWIKPLTSNIIKLIDHPELVQDKRALIVDAFAHSSSLKSDPLIVRGLRMFAYWHVDLMKLNFDKFVQFAAKQHVSMSRVIAETLVQVFNASTFTEWTSMYHELPSYHRKYVRRALKSMSLYCKLPQLYTDIRIMCCTIQVSVM